ncbi:peroxisomal membrane protein 11B-like [Babylonia areolata]|uniref:peroxisomal membrane protein 11B-like n=1 Tax=Babylonia areolata TaxID=304850 RepID=UPI003FD61C0F
MEGHLVDKIVKFNSQASGRDKLFRLAQYCSKFISWQLQKADLAEDSVRKLQLLSTALSTCRKFLRVGKSVDFVHSALNSLHISDSILRWTITVSKLNQALYLLFDHIVLAGRIGIAKVDKEKWNELSAKFWLITLTLGIIRDLYDMANILSQELRSREAEATQQQHKLTGDIPENNNIRHKAGKRVPSRNQVIRRCLAENKPLVLDLVKNLSDLVLPLEALGHIQASPGAQGLAGVISSVIGIATTWQPMLRLVPS